LLGDILFALGDTPVSDVEEVQAALTPRRIHQPVSASLLRSGQRVELPITVGERPGQSCG
ncbi:MAG TPA: S1C family serine protease, partial [Candidatus Competibacteraceae bacterium]|nr:S1C family serine protease [Candidatus Competibacteraceae bacterium]